MHFASHLPNFARTLLLFAALLAQAASAQTKPALVRNVDRPEAQPVYGTCTFLPADICTLYKVPSGKTLVVQTASFNIRSSDPDTSHRTSYVAISFPEQTMYLNPGAPMFRGGYVFYTGTAPLHMTVSENKALIGGASEFWGTFYGDVTFSGYLVDK